MAYFKVQSLYYPGEGEEKHDNLRIIVI